MSEQRLAVLIWYNPCLLWKQSLLGGSSMELQVTQANGRDGVDAVRLKDGAEDAVDGAEDGL